MSGAEVVAEIYAGMSAAGCVATTVAVLVKRGNPDASAVIAALFGVLAFLLFLIVHVRWAW